ncbi:ArsC/Spx/MgsR family protein (plasmid) [Enterococcus sp. 22-H-5-01]|uniref:ArsC/Spx/MgsR family protein n=1 Tax=Enterococcus sp. 22-H-5-01 TaxID=3418555 RepID=UPI003D03C3FC
MVIIYTDTSNLSSKKAVNWLKENDILFTEIKLNKIPITKRELKNLLSFSENGLDDLLSASGHKEGFDDLTLEEALDKVILNPRFLKKPIICDERTLQTGFNDEMIRVFIPKNKRKKYIIV